MSSSRIKYLGAVSAILGGAIWLLLWIHFLLTHGLTRDNEKRLLFGLTWIDSDKLAVIPMLLFMLFLVSLRAWQKESTSRLGTVGYVIALVCSPLVIIGQALKFWPIPWGSYPSDAYWDSLLTMQIGVPLTFFGTPVLSLGLVLFGVDILRRKPLPHGNALPLLLGIMLFTLPWLHEGVHAWLFGLSWGVLGYILWRATRQASIRSSSNA